MKKKEIHIGDKGLRTKDQSHPSSFIFHLSSFILFFFFSFQLSSQNISINDNGSRPDTSAMLDVVSTEKGMLIPRMVQAERNAIFEPARGLLIFQTDQDSGFYFNQGVQATPNWLRIKTEADTNHWIKTDTSLYYEGNPVGIGTNIPVNTLDIRSAGLDDAPILDLGNSDRSHFVSIFGGRLNDPNPFVMWKDGDPLRFATDNSGYEEKMRITSAGRLGVGTTAPTELVELSQTASDNFILINSGNASSNLAGFKLYENSLSFGWNIYMDASDDRLVFSHQAGVTESENLTLTQSGNLGIEQVSPSVKLQIDGGSDVSLSGGSGYLLLNHENTTNLVFDDNEILARNNGSESVLYLQNEGGGLSVQEAQGGGTEFVIQDDGRVGIGESNPQGRLDVLDNAVIGNTLIGSESNDQVASNQTGQGFLTTPWIYTSAIQAQNDRGVGSTSIILGNDGNYGSFNEINFVTNGTKKMEIAGNGEVLIGTVSTSNALLTLADDDGDLSSGLQFSNSSAEDWYIFQNASNELVIRDDGIDRLQIDPNGNLLPASDNTYDLGSVGNRWENVYATNGSILTSDIRFKTNIKKLDYGLKEILQIEPITFNWKEDENPELKLGLSAQQLLEIIPEIVKSHQWEKDQNGLWLKKELEKYGVYYTDLIPVLIKAIQEQQKLIENHKIDNQKQQKQIDQLLEEFSKFKKDFLIDE